MKERLSEVKRSVVNMRMCTGMDRNKDNIMDFVCRFLACFEKEFEKAVLEKLELERKKYGDGRLSYIADRRKFGMKLRRLRKEAGLTRDEAVKLAKKSSPTMITYYETGMYFPPEEYIENLGKLLNLPDEEIKKLKQELKCLKIVKFRSKAGHTIEKRSGDKSKDDSPACG